MISIVGVSQGHLHGFAIIPIAMPGTNNESVMKTLSLCYHDMVPFLFVGILGAIHVQWTWIKELIRPISWGKIPLS